MALSPRELLSGNTTPVEPEDLEEDGSVSLLDNGDMEIEIELEETGYEEFEDTGEESLMPGGHFEELSVFIEEDELQGISELVIDACEADRESRAEWEHTLEQGIKSLGISGGDTSNYGIAYDGMCTASHPLLLESAVKFQSKYTSELLPASGPAKTQILGKKTEEKEHTAKRVKDHMNYQCTQQMPEFYEETDRMAFHLALYGSSFKKCYYDMSLSRPVSEFVHVDKFIIADTAKSLESAERYTHIIEKTTIELQRLMDAGVYRYNYNVLNAGGSTGADEDGVIIVAENDAIGVSPSGGVERNTVHTLYEQHVYMELPEEVDGGVVLPYVITVDKDTNQVLSIRRNWAEDDPTQQMLQWFSHYTYVPGFGFYGFGLIHLLGDMQKTLTVVLRSLVDAGQFANLQGGFKAKGLRISKETEPWTPGLFKDVEANGLDITKSLVPLPFKEPSATLYQLLEYLTGASQKFADSTEQVVNDSTNYGPVGTTMALLESSVKFFSAVHRRGHRSQAKELKILARINYDFLPDEYPYEVVGEERTVFKADYNPRVVDVVPASDPNVTSQAHRISLAQSKLQAAMQAPQLHDMREAFKGFYLALGVEDVDKLLPPEDEAEPLDPMSDILRANEGKPIKAFPGQDHEAHVGFKIAWMQDPTQGGSGLFNSILPALQANVREHQLMAFQEQVGGAVQVTGAGTDPQTQQKVLAQAAQMVSQQHQQQKDDQEAGGPAGMIARAEMMKAQADLMKEQREAKDSRFKHGIDLLKATSDLEREETRSKEAGRKLDLEAQKLQSDLIKQAADIATGQKDVFKDQTKAK